MLKKICLSLGVIILLNCFAFSAGASSLFLDGWGVTPDNLMPTSAPSNTSYVQEIYDGDDPNGYIGPGWGGHTFDAMSAYIGFDGTKTYLAVVTGLPQSGAGDYWRYDNASYNGYYDWNQSLEKYWYVPGSMVLDVNGDGEYEYAVTTRANTDGATYASTPGEGMLVSGNLEFEDPKSWDKYDEYDDFDGIANPWAVTGYDNLVDLGADFSYSYFGDATVGSETFATYAIEAVIDTSLLGIDIGDTLAMRWTMECGNDIIGQTNEVPVPEPATMLLLGGGIAGLIGFRKKLKS